MAAMFHFFEKNLLKIVIYAIVFLLVGFLVFFYFYFGNTFMEFKFINLFISKANLYPVHVLSAEQVMAAHAKKIEKIEIDWGKN